MAKLPAFLQNIDEVTCPICLEVYEKPLKIVCGHTFCTVCLKQLTEHCTEPSCPECRATFSLCDVHKNSDIDRIIRKQSTKCAGCGQVVSLSQYRQHALGCQSLTGMAKEKLKFKPVAKTSQPLPKDVPNRQTFTCPYCGLKNLDIASFRNHCNDNHAGSRVPVVCPVCASMPWGDPNLTSGDFIKHLNIRHKFEYDTYVDYQEDEEETLRRVMEESMQSK